jgi:hypothetical protein
MASSRLEDVLAAVKAGLESRRSDAQQRAEAIKAAAESYAAAVEQDLAAELAQRAGLAAEEGAGNAKLAAQRLRELIEALPELAEPPSRQRELPAPSRPTQDDRPRPEPAPKRSEVVVYEAGPEARSLWEELHSLDFETMPAPLFRAYASELAARARSLQERGLNAEDIPGRIIRRLTRLAYDRAVIVFGLKRSDRAPWDELARKHHAERERILSGEPKQLTHKLPLSPELKEKASPPPAEEEPPEEEPEQQTELPHVRERAQSGPVVLVGGIAKQEKLERLHRHYGIEVEWIDTQRPGMHAISGLEKRVRDGRVLAVVVLDGLLGHKHYEPIVEAARLARVPVAYGDKAGKASLAAALKEIDAKLGELPRE